MTTNYRLPRNSKPHRIAAIALYRTLLLQCRAFPAAATYQRIELQNIVRNRFWQARHENSTRRLRLLFEAGYEGIDHLDAAVAGEEESKSRILDLLERAPAKVKQPRPGEHVQPLVPTQRPSDRLSLLDRPVPLEQLKGKRHVPVLFNAQGIPVLRIKKPQPEGLSGYINHRLQLKQKRHDTRHRLEEELELARAEDTWDEILLECTAARLDGTTERVREQGWSHALAMAKKEVNEKLSEERRKNQVMAEKMQAVVDREQALYDEEKADRKQKFGKGRQKVADGTVVSKDSAI
ncbi:hypothetical protein LTR78_007842 [Recurvomyces mirabilis]|uniref:Complex 1 LYR protein domain-containing protein n=1 Tax=Recurvomyces mirabilis TaxID=574656 RepID=A0AAE0WH84_9PEZI|nr:hypothetical protein LTR78_007842 [Recurvomyces mirabilis]KAK5160116.1 hypothetical protein LTS14_002223 [Recurvomyces mirabilis]